ncbi:MAG: elongation factor Ts [Hyphomonadaceae bacterium]|nr:elongation factor Ts [Hyphomonadaceae bacterium]
MAQITAALVKELRDKTSAGMMDCKKALTENNGDIEAAIDWLRKKGIAKATKKSGRVASEGLIGLSVNGTTGALVEVNSETDFVARNDEFQCAVTEIAGLAVEANGDLEALANANTKAGNTVSEFLTGLIATIGENMSLRRTSAVNVSNGAVTGYMHSAAADGLGKIGVLVGLESDGDAEALTALGKKIAMHVAATSPLALTVEDLDPAAVERERTVLSDQARASGKPEAIIEKMVEGRIRKFYEESVLLNQIFVMDGERTIAKVIEDEAKSLGSDIKMTGFVRMELGEGIEKKEEDFAAEVAALGGA